MIHKLIPSLALILFVGIHVCSNSFFAFALSPSDIANRVFHFDAQNLDGDNNPANQPVNSSAVSQLIDLANTHTGSQVTPGKQAIYQTNIINSKPALYFDGVDDIYNIPDSLTIGSDNTYPEKSFAAIFKTSNDITTLQTIYEQGGQEKGYGIQIESGNLYVGAWNNLDWPVGEQYKVVDVGTIQANTTYNIMFSQESVSSNTLKVFLNGQLVANVLNVDPQTTHGQCMISGAFSCYLFSSGGSIGLGAMKNDTLKLSDLSGLSGEELYPFQGHIGEIMTWNKALTISDISGLFAYFDDRWRLRAPEVTINNPFVTGIIQPGNFDIQLGYNDFNNGTGIDLSSDVLELYKWNGSTWGSDISAGLVNFAGKTMDNYTAIYPVTAITTGKYRIIYTISKTNTLSGSGQRDFYVGELDPSDVPAPVFHYDAQDINGDNNLANNPANGSTIQTLVDKFNAYNAFQNTAGNRPLLENNSINSYPSISFNGSNQYFDINNQSAINTASNYSQKSFAAVFKTGADVNTSQTIFEQGGTIRGYSFVIHNGHVYAGVWNNNEWDAGHQYKSVDLGPATPNTVYFSMIVQDSQTADDNLNTLKIYLNGNLTSTQIHTDEQISHGGAIGLGRVDGNTVRASDNTAQNTGHYFNGKIGELISWNHAFDQAEVNGIQEYFSARWGVVLFSEVTPVANPTSETNPSYTFSTNTVGTLSYGGSCNSSTTTAILGNNTIQFDSDGSGGGLSNGTYSDCVITLTDGSGFPHVLNVTPFTVNAATLVLTETTAVPTPGSNHLPQYTFNSPIAGAIQFNGACSTNTPNAIIGDNIVTLNYLADGTYSDCYVRVDDGVTPTAFLQLSAFTITSSVPTIGTGSISENQLLPIGVFDFTFDYSDVSPINLASAGLILQKYDSATTNWGTDIAGGNIIENSVTSTLASYSASTLSFGKYRFTFDIANTGGGTSQIERIFYIDEVEFSISGDEFDVGNLNLNSLEYSSEVTITVKTLGAGFRVNMQQPTDMLQSTNILPKYDGGQGFGFDQSPYTATLTQINNSQIANQTTSINTSGEKNTYTYNIKLGALVNNQEMVGGDYDTDLRFDIILDY